MYTWEAKYIGRWGEKFGCNVAAKNFVEAIKKVKMCAKKGKHFRPRITALVRTATLDM